MRYKVEFEFITSYHIYLGSMMINLTLGVTVQTLKILYVCHCVTFTWSLQQ